MSGGTRFRERQLNAFATSQAGKTAKYINTYVIQQHQGIAKFTFPFGNETILALSGILSVVTITKFVKFVEFLFLLLLLLLLWLLYPVVAMRTFLLTPLIPTSVAVIVIQALQFYGFYGFRDLALLSAEACISKTTVCKISILLEPLRTPPPWLPVTRDFTITFPFNLSKHISIEQEKHNSIEICIKYSSERRHSSVLSG
uniref:Uncharacterized protein n=1 Tax=Glossina austeni TaxID=7395 RepID=A0A1A9VRV6_GLOAU